MYFIFVFITGIYKNEGPFDVYIDLHRVKELFAFEVCNKHFPVHA